MNYRRAISVLLLSVLFVLCVALAASAQQLPPPHPTAAAQQTPARSVVPAIPSYPDSPGGLQKLFKEMLKLEKNGKTNALAPYVQSLILPNSDVWFRSTFGDAIGGSLAGDYERTQAELPVSFPDTLADLVAKHLPDPEAIRFTDSCNSHASETEYPILLLRANVQPLYDVRFEYGNRLTLIPYFAYVDGAFRYLGNFHVRTQNFPSKRVDVKRVRVGGNVIMARLIHRTMPVYPVDAKIRGVQGTVLLHALIGADGNVHDLQVMQGPCSLAQSAVKAVSQWRYKPTMLEGNPVQVDTTITVIFNLGSR
ncbi:MAG TPA: energy transducer TonB [Candidatus Acidoferrales bacterium]|nr:energy transducer TonB [Candidatus Acidoferrales bacterium]